jgi:hypothetical protein
MADPQAAFEIACFLVGTACALVFVVWVAGLAK